MPWFAVDETALGAASAPAAGEETVTRINALFA
jgi:hypothetical protein